MAALYRAIEHFRAMVAALGMAPVDIPKSRNGVRDLVGKITISRENGEIIAELGEKKTALTALAVGAYIGWVAGACFGAYLEARIR